MTFDQLVTVAGARGASDIHLRAGHVPLVRINGELERWTQVAPLTAAHLEAIAARLLPPVHQERLQTKLEVDVAWQAAGVGRCRASVFRQRGTIAVSMRLIPDKIPSLQALGLPQSVVSLSEESRGLVLVTGVTGSGKSTTLAAIVDLINRTRSMHILTIEDPIEFVHRDARAVITQREIGFDTPTYASGLRSALRQDPDVILIGEMRDPETIETALVAAETGHLVFSTLHTLDAPETINRIVSAFPPHQQQQIRHQLARVLRAAVSQRLMPRADGKGRALAAEVLMSTAYIRDCIMDPAKTSLIADAIASGVSEYGMQSFDQAILKLYQQDLVTLEEALRWVTNVEEFKMRLRGITPGGGSGSISTGKPEIMHYGLDALVLRRRRSTDQEALPPGGARLAALRLLGRRDFSAAEVTTRLIDRGHPADEVHAVVRDLLADRTLDDRRVAAAHVRTASLVKHRGRLRIRRELEARGIDKALVGEALAELPTEDDTAAIRLFLARRRAPARPDPATRRRLFQQLLRRGFDAAAIARALGRDDQDD